VAALRTLEATQAGLQRTVKEAATGKAVATVDDNPAAYVLAQRLTSDAQAWAAVNSGLGGAQVPTLVANTAMNGITGVLSELKNAAIEVQAGGDSGSAETTRIQALLLQINGYQTDATVNGTNLIAGGVAGDIQTTRINVPRSPDGRMLTIGDRSISAMNASVSGLGLDTFNGLTDGMKLSFTSLDVTNISTAAPPTSIEIRTANYGNTNPADPHAESPQNPGQSWTFVFTDAAAPAAATDLNGPADAAGNITHADHTIPVPLPSGFTLNDAINALQAAMSSLQFETKFDAQAPTGPTLSVAGNNVGLAASAQNLRPTQPPRVVTEGGYRTQTIAAGSTRIDLGAITVPPSGNVQDYVGATYLQNQADIDAYMAGPRTTPAFYLVPFSASIPPGTTITAVDPAIPSRYFNISSPATADIPVPLLPGGWDPINMLMPNPVVPTTSTASWGGAEGAIATLNSAMNKAGDISQNLGNAINSLKSAQDHASEQIDVTNGGIGNLVDADLGKVGAQLQAMQIRQQLAAQSVGLGNQWPQLLLQLFR
jgi:flagellin-like hook-associated protein FlgL